jgi:hypothetical protein
MSLLHLGHIVIGSGRVLRESCRSKKQWQPEMEITVKTHGAPRKTQ